MKRKILSLALALMMILSVAAAMPVSAIDYDPIIVAADDYISGSAGGSGDLTADPADDHGWIPGKKGFLFHENTSDDVTYEVDAPVAGYYNLYLAGAKYGNNGIYSLYLNGSETADRADIVISTSSTSSTDAQVSLAIPLKLNQGKNTIRLKATADAAGDYFYGFKLEYAGDSLKEIFLNPRGGKKSNANYIFSVTTDPTYDGMTWGAGNGGVYHFKNLTSSTSYTMNLDESEAGTYGVYVAVGTEGTATGQVTVGDSKTEKVSITSTGSRTTAKEVYLGAVNIPEGSQTIKIEFATKDSHMNLYDIKLEKLQAYKITANATEGGTATGAAAVAGESATITATADAGYIFDGWYKDGAKVSDSASYTVENVQADAVYEARFRAGLFIELREGTKSATSHLFGSNTSAPTYDGMTWGDGQADDVFWYKGVSTFKYNVSGTITASKTGYYDVFVAAGTTTAVSAKFEAGAYSTAGNIQATATATTVKENNIGRVYLTANEATAYKLWATSGTGHTYIFDVMLLFSDDQSVPATILKPQEGTKSHTNYVFNLSAAPTYEGMTWGDGAADGCYFWNGQTTGLNYTLNTPDRLAGYYEVYVAAGNAATAKATATVGESTTGKVVVTETASRTTANETYLGRIYIPAGESTFEIRFEVGSDKLNVYDIMLKYSDDQTKPIPLPVILNLGSATMPNGVGGGPWDNTQTDSSSWITGKAIMLSGAKSVYDEKQNLVLSATIKEEGWYDIYVGAYSATIGGTFYSGNGFLLDVYDNDAKIAENVSFGDLTGNTSKAAKTVLVASAYFEAGTHTIKIVAAKEVAILVGMQFVYAGADKTATALTFTDKNGKVVSTISEGSEIFAEVTSATVTDGVIFFAQYAGSGAEKRLVATSFSEAKAAYAGRGTNLYRAMVKVAEGADEVKAFLWKKDGSYAPVMAAATISVN